MRQDLALSVGKASLVKVALKPPKSPSLDYAETRVMLEEMDDNSVLPEMRDRRYSHKQINDFCSADMHCW